MNCWCKRIEERMSDYLVVCTLSVLKDGTSRSVAKPKVMPWIDWLPHGYYCGCVERYAVECLLMEEYRRMLQWSRCL